MSEAGLGYLEALFMAMGVLSILWVIRHSFDPARREEMAAHARRLIEQGDDGNSQQDDPHGQT